MLHKFLTSNRIELIRRCEGKTAKRFSPSLPPAIINHGVPLFLQQVADTLRAEQLTAKRESNHPEPTPAGTDIGHAAALHGAELLRLGYTIDQVVHEYGDVCQSVTDMAVEKKLNISPDEFRTLNRCLDNAIADAVAAFSQVRKLVNGQHEDSHLQAFLAEHARLVDVALHAFGAIRTGNVGLRGPTGNLLHSFLEELRSLPQRTLLAKASKNRKPRA